MRRRYLVAYDICDDVRLRRVHDVVRSFGLRLQYSVFVCDLDGMEKIALKTRLRGVMLQNADSVMFIDLGEPSRGGVERFEFLGVAVKLPTEGPLIV
jgi:CRISPR-associated protein Cas2